MYIYKFVFHEHTIPEKKEIDEKESVIFVGNCNILLSF